MSVSAISTSSAWQQVSSATNQGSPRGGAMKSLVDSIDNGDMTGARSAFDALQKNRPGAGATSSSGPDKTAGTSQRDQDIAALGKAIDSGDADAAKQALAKLRDDGKNAAGAAQGAQGTQAAQGAHHHHHGHKTQAAGDSSATSGGTQDTALTYSAAAMGTQTAAPGSTIDVSV
jgi:hypothetical protein